MDLKVKGGKFMKWTEKSGNKLQDVTGKRRVKYWETTEKSGNKLQEVTGKRRGKYWETTGRWRSKFFNI